MDELDLIKASDYIEKNCGEGLKICTALSNNLTRIKESFSGEGQNRASELSSKLLLLLRKSSYKLSQLSSDVPDFLSEDIEAKALLTENDFIKVFIEEDYIYIRLPRLWSRNNEKLSRCPEQYRIYSELLFQKIALINFEDYDLSGFNEKIIDYLFVYGSGENDISDNDNHEIKYIQDSITAFLPGGDSALCCSIFCHAMLCDKIPPGTYITVTKEKIGILPGAGIIDYWYSKNLGGANLGS